jgi:predicted RNA-binding protein YlxR (DUF448 family)
VGGRKSAQRSKSGEPQATHRLCALTRLERPLDELVRFVAAPDGEIVPDVARQLPGRGVWVTADKEAVSAAVKSKVFAKSLKCEVKVAPDLAQRVDNLLQKRVLEALSLANKAGLVTTGFTKVEALLEGGGVAALVHGSEAAADGRLKLDRKLSAGAGKRGLSPSIVDSLSIEQLSLAIGRSNVVHAALTQGGATERFLSEAGRMMRYRSGSNAPGKARTPKPEV